MAARVYAKTTTDQLIENNNIRYDTKRSELCVNAMIMYIEATRSIDYCVVNISITRRAERAQFQIELLV